MTSAQDAMKTWTSMDEPVYPELSRNGWALYEALDEAEREITYWQESFYEVLEELSREVPDSVYRFTGGKKPSPREIKSAQEFFNRQPTEASKHLAAWREGKK